MINFRASFINKVVALAVACICAVSMQVTSYASSGLFTQAIAEAKQVNSDVEGWIYIPNTNISYPVLQYDGNCPTHGVPDHCYYLNRNINKQYAPARDNSSAIFMDYRNNGLDGEHSKNTVIYGHNWTNVENGYPLRVTSDVDKMFAQLPSFANKEFAEKTPYFIIENGSEQFVYVIFAAGYVISYDNTSKTGFYYIDPEPQGEDFNQLVSGMKDRSVFKYDVDVTDSDEIVTLSTCTYKQTANGNGRFVVMGRLLRDGEQIPTTAKFLDNNTISISVTQE